MSHESNPAKFYTKKEEVFNAVTHGTGSLLSIVGTSVLVTIAALFSSSGNTVICLLYGLSLIVLYTMSTLYHAFSSPSLKQFFRVLDHSTIYLLIAGTYTPFTLISLAGNSKGIAICISVWALALVGIVLNMISIERFKKVSMFLYVFMGWAVLFALPDIIRALSGPGFWLLLLGGVCYTGGIVFYAAHTRYMHGIWHLFVLAGSIFHYLCILLYVLPPVCNF